MHEMTSDLPPCHDTERAGAVGCPRGGGGVGDYMTTHHGLLKISLSYIEGTEKEKQNKAGGIRLSFLLRGLWHRTPPLAHTCPSGKGCCSASSSARIRWRIAMPTGVRKLLERCLFSICGSAGHVPVGGPVTSCASRKCCCCCCKERRFVPRSRSSVSLFPAALSALGALGARALPHTTRTSPIDRPPPPAPPLLPP